METYQPSRAKAYFDKIALPENGAEFLKSLVDSEIPTYESEFLDFKGCRELKVNSKELLELWAKNLSCFANSDGGVLVFGIDAPRGKPLHLSLVQDVAGLCARLKDLLPKITEPPVQRVEISAYPEPAGANTGFIVCYIPASPWRPHQVRTDGQPGQFYVRATDNCIPCGHSTLRALFAPQFVSGLEIYCRHDQRVNPVAPWMEVTLRFSLLNRGPATASELLVTCEPRPVQGLPMCDLRFWTEVNNSSENYAFLV